MSKPITFSFNGQQITAQPDESIRACAKRLGFDIPGICSGINPHYRTDGSCRLCMVEIKGERTLAASCKRQPTDGMDVSTTSPRAEASRRMVMELLLADRPAFTPSTYQPADRFLTLGEQMDVSSSRFTPAADGSTPDTSHPAIDVDMSKCILCTNCVRACQEIQSNAVIGIAGRGHLAHIVFDQGDALAFSSCVACGECVQACPTGALLPKAMPHPVLKTETVDSLCPYCGVGCQVTYHVKDDKIIYTDGRDGPANLSRLCVKGRFGFDYTHHPDRLTKPLIRIEGVAKDPAILNGGDAFGQFREATWEEALGHAAASLESTCEEFGADAIAGFGSAKGSNEEAYLFQKLMRTAFKTNNVDHCTRLCHASSVAALMEGIGSGAVTAPFTDAEKADVILVIGARPSQNHPVASTYIKAAKRDGAKLIVLDPRGQALSRHADYGVQFKPGADVALLNAMLHVIITEDLVDHAYIEQRVNGFEEFSQHIKTFTPERMAEKCGVDAGTIRAIARTFAQAKRAIIFWGMGVSQHTHGTDNARCLIALALITGNVGRPGTGLHPLRGQNNVQGASDAGLIPMVLPDYTRVDDDFGRGRFETVWQMALNPVPGLTVVEIMHAALAGDVRAMYIMGENPAMSDPDLNKARRALASLDHLVVQDIFMTETAMLADVILPATSFYEKTGSFTNSNRQVQLGRQVLPPPGDAREDLIIIQDIAKRLGLDWHYKNTAHVFEEMRRVMPSHAGISHQRLEREGSVTYPCTSEEHAGEEILFGEGFPMASGKARLVPAQTLAPDEEPDEAYPFILTTGRMLEHWHTGAMTRRASVLDALEPGPVIALHPKDLAQLGLVAGDGVTLTSRRGTLTAATRADSDVPQGVVFLAFAFHEAAANLLTNPSLDPFGKIAELKYCAVKVEKT
ncbi:formate dehydrogenase subunit alpha [Magnetovibrio blakemorei]|uniref:Formate dehydrogenase subunit alpha n=1 Tax=Magnetovibrio blakemorei TaxID=28181 RepID=A0A1E5Q7I6_9PROT|nr:formate dehydrogenase subunit alpha [Magnetovibrio blakemorei]OEJ66993.1 formate dehydrogenase subunit alpha [Magnetovibrio blakemorei]